MCRRFLCRSKLSGEKCEVLFTVPDLAIFGRLAPDFRESKCFLRGPETPVEMK
jgi:hypothetical protein